MTVSSFIGVLALLSATCTVVLFSTNNTILELETDLGDNIDQKFLVAEASGKDGRAFLQKLQNIWFVSSQKKLDAVAKETTRLATKLQTAEFPTEVLNAVNKEVNPCDDFYEFSVMLVSRYESVTSFFA